MKQKIVALYRSVGAEAIRYVLIGGCTTLVNFGVFTLMTKCMGFDSTARGVTVANAVSIVVSILFAYVANKLFVFRRHCPDLKNLVLECLGFICGRGIAMVMELVGVDLLVNRWGMAPLPGKLIMQVFVIVSNYFVSKFLVFRKDKKEADQSSAELPGTKK